MFRCLFIGLVLFICSCSSTPQSGVLPQQRIELTGGPVYVVPFETIMVPGEVSENLFDLFIDSLNENGAAKGIEFIILKQGFQEIDKAWLADKSYIRGELFAYVEEVGSSMTDIKARSRIRFYLPTAPSPALQLVFPTEVFFQNDYSTLAAERRKLAVQVAENLVMRFLTAIQVQ
jgi:hypothetical protein